MDVSIIYPELFVTIIDILNILINGVASFINATNHAIL